MEEDKQQQQRAMPLEYRAKFPTHTTLTVDYDVICDVVFMSDVSSGRSIAVVVSYWGAMMTSKTKL